MNPPACYPGRPGRLLRDRHADGCGGSPCLGCEPCPVPHCSVCRIEHSNGTCPGCTARVRDDLADLVRTVRLLPGQAVTGREAYRTKQGVPGGEALVLLAPVATRRAVRLPDDPTDSRPPLDVLVRWAAWWADETGTEAPRYPTVVRVAAWLDERLTVLAAHPRFPDVARDLARTLHRVEDVVHAGDRPDVSRVPCWECGARLYRVWAPTEADDHWKCPACGEVYDQGRYDRAKLDHLRSADANRYVNLMDAVQVTGRPEQTVRAWVRDGLVSTRRGPTGRLEVWWPDVRDRDLATPTRRTRSRYARVG